MGHTFECGSRFQLPGQGVQGLLLNGAFPRSQILRNFDVIMKCLKPIVGCSKPIAGCVTPALTSNRVRNLFSVIRTSKQELKKILDSKSDFGFRGNLDPDEAPWPGLAYQWFCLGESKTIENKLTSYMTYHEGGKIVIILGGIALGDKEFVVHATSRTVFDFLKKMVEHYFKDSLKYRMESVVERAQQVADKAGEGLPVSRGTILESVFPGGKAPLNDAERKVLHENYRKNYEKFLNKAVPMLNGMTPLAAAGDTEMRPRLVSLMKGHINNLDELRKKDKVTIDISWVLEKLDLHELI